MGTSRTPKTSCIVRPYWVGSRGPRWVFFPACVPFSVCLSVSPIYLHKPHLSSPIFVSSFCMYLFLPGTVSQGHCQHGQVKGLDTTLKDRPLPGIPCTYRGLRVRGPSVCLGYLAHPPRPTPSPCPRDSFLELSVSLRSLFIPVYVNCLPSLSPAMLGVGDSVYLCVQPSESSDHNTAQLLTASHPYLVPSAVVSICGFPVPWQGLENRDGMGRGATFQVAGP